VKAEGRARPTSRFNHAIPAPVLIFRATGASRRLINSDYIFLDLTKKTQILKNQEKYISR